MCILCIAVAAQSNVAAMKKPLNVKEEGEIATDEESDSEEDAVWKKCKQWVDHVDGSLRSLR